MKYIEVTFSSTPFNDIISESLVFYLAEIGFESFVTEENKLIGYILAKSFSKEKINSILDEFPIDTTSISYESKECEDKDWNEEWEKNYFSPIIIGNELIIKSTFHKDVPNLKYNIFINPKMAFGTGHHQTTRLMLESMLSENFNDQKVLDMGCGTGVLGILSSLRGAKEVVAIDIDKWSYANIIENIELNEINQTTFNVEIGDASALDKFENNYFNIILANINRNILIQDLKKYNNVLNKNGSLFISGFYTEDIPLLEQEWQKYNLKKVSERYKDNWAVVKLIKY